MRLPQFILSNIEPILVEWEAFARSLASAGTMDSLALRDHAQEILLATVADMKASEGTEGEPWKTREDRRRAAKRVDGTSELHAVGRLGAGFDLLEVVSEYRALRASVLDLWSDNSPIPTARDIGDVHRFNESIDHSLAEAVTCFTKRVDQSRDLFLAILGHDLRNPLNAIAVTASIFPRLAIRDPQSAELTARINASVSVMSRMISDLLDYTRTRLGAGMPVSPRPMDLRVLCVEVHEECRAGHPEREVQFESSGDLNGIWDRDRLRQAISNVLGNAIQHGPDAKVVRLSVAGTPEEVTIAIYNGGTPIPAGEISHIFEPLARGSNSGNVTHRAGSIGLGLYIAREVVHAHGGTIVAHSTIGDGTIFTILLPRNTTAIAAESDQDDIHSMPPTVGSSDRASVVQLHKGEP